MVSHLVSRRSYTPYGVILHHPCGSYSHAKDHDADEPLFGEGPVCDACMHPSVEMTGVTVAAKEQAIADKVAADAEEPVVVKITRPTRPKPRD